MDENQKVDESMQSGHLQDSATKDPELRQEDGSKEKFENTIQKTINGAAQGLYKATVEARHDERDIADVKTEFKVPDINLSKKEQNQTEGRIVGVEATQNTPEIKGETKATGEVIDFGKAKYQFDKKESDSYFIKTKDPDSNNEIVTWGKDLETRVQESNIQKGDFVNIENLGRKNVTVNKPIKDEKGEIIEYESINTHRNTFKINKVDPKELKAEKEISSENRNGVAIGSEEKTDSNEKVNSEIAGVEAKSDFKKKAKESQEEESQENEIKDNDILNEESLKEKNLVKALSNSTDYDQAVGEGEKVKNVKDLIPTKNIGYKEEINLPNGEVALSVSVNKEKWINDPTLVDKKGNLRMSLYEHGKEGIHKTRITLSRDVVKTMPTDENGNIKLLVKDRDPLSDSSKVDVYMDNKTTRNKILQENPKHVYNKSPYVEREKILNEKLSEGPYNHGYDTKINVSLKEVMEHMEPRKKGVINDMSNRELKNMVTDLDNVKEFSKYHTLHMEKYMANFKKGMSVEIPGDSIGKDSDSYEEVKFVNQKYDDVLVKDNDGKEHVVKEETIQTGIPSDENIDKIHDQTLKALGDNMKVEGFKEKLDTAPVLDDEEILNEDRKLLLELKDAKDPVEVINRERTLDRKATDEFLQRYKLADDYQKSEKLSGESNFSSDKTERTNLIKDQKEVDLQIRVKSAVSVENIYNHLHHRIKGDPPTLAEKMESNYERIRYGKDVQERMNDVRLKEKMGLSIEEIDNKDIQFDKKRQEFKVRMNYGKPEESTEAVKEKEVNKALEKQITPETKAKDYVEKMDVGDQGKIKKQSPEDLTKDIYNKTPEFEKSEKYLNNPSELNGEGQAKKSPGQQLSDAIYKNDSNKVEELLQNNEDIANKEHSKLMTQMKAQGIDLDSKIEQNVSAALPVKESQGIRV